LILPNPDDVPVSPPAQNAIRRALAAFLAEDEVEAANQLYAAHVRGATPDRLAQAGDFIGREGILGGRMDRRAMLRFLGFAAASTAVLTLFETTPAVAVATDYWGFDSSTNINYDCGHDDLRKWAHDIYNDDPNFWGRYFVSPANTSSSLHLYHAPEGVELAAHNTNHLVPLTSPHQPHLEQHQRSQGVDDATAALDDVHHAVAYGDELEWPATDGKVILWLDCEPTTSLTDEYWDGWADTVANYQVSGINHFLPGLYGNPQYGNICSVAHNASRPPYRIWSTYHADIWSGSKPPKLPAWRTDLDQPGECNAAQAAFWQFGHDSQYSGLRADCYSVDVDVVDPGNNSFQLNHTLHLPLT
jgi:hypothetical protein